MTWARINARRLGWALAALIVCALSLDAHAVTDYTAACPSGQTKTWKAFAGGGACTDFVPGNSTYPTLQAAETAYKACRDAVDAQTGNHVTEVFQVTPSSTPATGNLFRFTRHSTSSPTSSVSQTYSQTFQPVCAVAACNLPTGTFLGYGEDSGPSTVCTSSCQATKVAGATWEIGGVSTTVYEYRTTGQSCTAGGGTPAFTPRETPSNPPIGGGGNTLTGTGSDGESCGMVNGERVCTENPNCGTVNGETICLNDAPNCGTVNGQSTCVADVPTGECAITPGGQTVCTAPAGVPPAPNNGTSLTQAAQPDVTATKPDGTVHNIYNQTTTNNSNTLITNSGGTPPGGGDPGEGEGEGGDGQGETGNVKGKGGIARTFGASNAMIYNAAIDSPLGEAIAGISGAFPTGGTCPPFAIDAPIIGSISTNIHCDVFDGQVRPVLASVMLAVYAVFAVLIILGRN